MCARDTVFVVAALGFVLGTAATAKETNGVVEANGVVVDLEGTWYVLTHYRDAAAAEPDVDRWSDRIWRFEHKNGRIGWTEYSIVEFRNQSGRFESLGASRTSRILHNWRPNATQLAEIRDGLRVDARGIRTKTLRGSVARGYTSGSAMRSNSTSIIGYEETWTIDGLSEGPIFARSDAMASGRSDRLEGRTEFATEEVLHGGRELRGRFARDEHQQGTFEMIRAGEVDPAGGKLERRGEWPRGTP